MRRHDHLTNAFSGIVPPSRSLGLAPDNPDSPQNVRQSLIHQQCDRSSEIATETKVRDRRISRKYLFILNIFILHVSSFHIYKL